MALIIRGLSLPKEEDGTYFIPGYEVRGVEIGTVVMTLMLDQKTQKLRMSVWNPEYVHGLERSYPCLEIDDSAHKEQNHGR